MTTDAQPTVTESTDAAETVEAAAGGSRLRSSAGMETLKNLLPAAVLVVMVLYFSLETDAFFTQQNMTVMSGQAGILLLAALGATFVIIMGSIDLSVGAGVLLTGAILSKVVGISDTSMVAVLGITLLVGVVMGLVNGIVFAYGKVPSFITTLGTLSIFTGAGLIIIDGQALQINNPAMTKLSIGQWIPGVQNTCIVALIAFVILYILGKHTRFGVYLYAIGGNEAVVRLSGIKVDRYKVLAFVLSAVTVALAGMLAAGQLGSGGPSLGSTTLLDSLAAIVVGGTALSGGVGGVHKTLLGVLIITVLASGLNQMGVDSFTQTVVKGAAIIVAAVFTMAAHRKEIVK